MNFFKLFLEISLNDAIIIIILSQELIQLKQYH